MEEELLLGKSLLFFIIQMHVELAGYKPEKAMVNPVDVR